MVTRLVFSSDFVTFIPTADSEPRRLVSIPPRRNSPRLARRSFPTFKAATFKELLELIPVPHVNAVPEPASWALMMVGFGLAGASLRRRVRAQVAA